MKIDPKNQILIEVCRAEIAKLSKQQDTIYGNMVAIIGEDSDYLWDFCFNSDGDSEYAQKCFNELF